MNTKALSEVKIVDEAEGKVTAVFATLNVIDNDGDVTRTGAFENGAKVRISAYNHASWGPGTLPVGKGVIYEKGDEAFLDGQFFMDTQSGRDTFHVVKEMDDLGEWSYGYDVLESSQGKFEQGGMEHDVQFLDRLKVHEVSPVILGAGIDTRTLAAKAAKAGDVKFVDVLMDLKLADHLDQVIEADEKLIERLADAVAQRATNGQKLAESTLERGAKLESSIKRLREALAIEPQTDPEWRKSMARLGRALEITTRKG